MSDESFARVLGIIRGTPIPVCQALTDALANSVAMTLAVNLLHDCDACQLTNTVVSSDSSLRKSMLNNRRDSIRLFLEGVVEVNNNIGFVEWFDCPVASCNSGLSRVSDFLVFDWNL